MVDIAQIGCLQHQLLLNTYGRRKQQLTFSMAQARSGLVVLCS